MNNYRLFIITYYTLASYTVMAYRVCSVVFIVRSAMTEKIVSVLKRMKCPHRLEPHQIQGLDFIHIYPVVQVNQFFLYYKPVGDWFAH